MTDTRAHAYSATQAMTSTGVHLSPCLGAYYGHQVARHREPATLTPADLAALPEGVQPEIDGRLVCLECGWSYRQLGQHIAVSHDMPVAEYRRLHGLAAGFSLHCADTRRVRAQLALQRWQGDESMRTRLRPNRTTAAERVALSRIARRASANRPGVAASMRANGAAAARAWTASIDDRYTDRVRGLGYTDLDAYFRTMQGIAARELAPVLDASIKQVQLLRKRHGFVSSGAGRAPGLGPEDRRVCRECGRTYLGLGQHISLKHGLTMAEYGQRHPDVRVAPVERAG